MLLYAPSTGKRVFVMLVATLPFNIGRSPAQVVPAFYAQFGSPLDDGARAIALDGGGIYVAGDTNGTLPGQTSAGGVDVFVRKYDRQGNVLWTRQFGTPSIEYGFGAATDATGVYVAGWTGGALPGQTFSGSADAYVRKYDPNGTELWTRQFGGAHERSVSAVAADGTGVYLTGQFVAGIRTDIFVRKYSPDGILLWEQQAGSPDNDYAAAVAVAPDGMVYVAGRADGALPNQINSGGIDAFVWKLNSGGTTVWMRQFGDGSLTIAEAIAVNATGIYVAGSTNALSGPPIGNGDAFLRKYDFAGNVVWTSQFGTGLSDTASGLAADDKSLYLSGYTIGVLPGQNSSGGQDAFIRAYDFSGNVIWTRQFGSDNVEAATAIAVDSTGIYTTGGTLGALRSQTSAGSADAFLAKFLPALPVQIDVKPDTYPNTINFGSRGSVPVAILSTGAFDARTIDPFSVLLANAGAKVNGRGTPLAWFEDVNRDGLPDLVVHISVEALQLAENDIEVVLEGVSFDRTVGVRGVDTVRIVP